MSIKKVTAFTGRASGDCECFCFDQRSEMIKPGSTQEPFSRKVSRGRWVGGWSLLNLKRACNGNCFLDLK